eukprot:131291-Prymnesium_polylepis.1
MGLEGERSSAICVSSRLRRNFVATSQLRDITFITLRTSDHTYSSNSRVITVITYKIVPAAPTHRPAAAHPDDDPQTLEPASRHRRGRVGALRGRHRATTYLSSSTTCISWTAHAPDKTSLRMPWAPP